MELLPHELRERIPRLYATERDDDPMVWVKFFTPDADWTWYVIEGSSQDDDYLMFGWVVGLEKELGYFLLSELEDVGNFGITVERDVQFEPCHLSHLTTPPGQQEADYA
jgi:hypothetical protein